MSFVFLMQSVEILPLNIYIRNTITSTIQNYCSKIENLIFAILIANNRLVCMVRMKQYYIHPMDLRSDTNNNLILIIYYNKSFPTELYLI